MTDPSFQQFQAGAPDESQKWAKLSASAKHSKNGGLDKAITVYLFGFAFSFAPVY